MKRTMALFVVVLLVLTLCSCGRSNTYSSGGIGPTESVSSAQAIPPSEKNEPSPSSFVADSQLTDEPVSLGGSEVDVDLTELSSTMVYSEVYSMILSPEKYIGKTIKMHGQFAVAQGVDANGNAAPDKLYFACLIADATACCAQGIEFVLEGEHPYPDDYPEPGAEVTVIGNFQPYAENGMTWYRLVGATME